MMCGARAALTIVKIYATPGLLIISGVCLLAVGAQLPVYSNPEWNTKYLVEVSLETSRTLSEEWYRDQREARTLHIPLVDGGLGLTMLGVSLAILLGYLRVKSWEDLGSLHTPSSPLAWQMFAVTTWLSFVPAEWASLYYTSHRGDYPWWADTIAIPAFGAAVLGVVGLPLVILGVKVCIRGRRLPAALWRRPLIGNPWLLGTAVLAVTALMFLIVVDSVQHNFLAVPSAVMAGCLLLCCRAAVAGIRG
jgi:hypothetical protein